MKRKCASCGHDSECRIDGRFCSRSCKALYIKKYYRERRKVLQALYRKYMK